LLVEEAVEHEMAAEEEERIQRGFAVVPSEGSERVSVVFWH
jgi:hypothetical protein